MSYPILLLPHPDTCAGQVESIAVQVVLLPTGALQLIYTLTGNLTTIRLPGIAPASRSNGLWQHTCFEAFIRPADSPAYREFNFSPSGQWQAYTFHTYRDGGLLEPATNPDIECLREPGRLRLQATLQPENLPLGACLRLGLSAVVQGAAGSISYWALQHAAGKPDFHHPDSFVLDITP